MSPELRIKQFEDEIRNLRAELAGVERLFLSLSKKHESLKIEVDSLKRRGAPK